MCQGLARRGWQPGVAVLEMMTMSLLHQFQPQTNISARSTSEPRVSNSCFVKKTAEPAGSAVFLWGILRHVLWRRLGIFIDTWQKEAWRHVPVEINPVSDLSRANF